MRSILTALRPENPCGNFSTCFPDHTSLEYSAQPSMLPFLNLHTRKKSWKIYTGSSRADYRYQLFWLSYIFAYCPWSSISSP